MAYERDRDAHTRGIGAIAAADGSRTRARRRMQVARALRERDRALSQITMGPRGGLGAIRGFTNPGSPTVGSVRTMDASPTTGGRGLTTDYTPPKLPGSSGGGTAPPSRTPISITTIASRAVTMAPRPAATIYGGKTAPPGSYGTGVTPNGGNVDPGGSLLPPTTISDNGSGTTTTSGSSGGGGYTGGGGGGGGGGAGVTTGGGGAPTFTEPAVPGEDIPQSSGMSNTTKALIAAGVIGGLYFLTKKKGP